MRIVRKTSWLAPLLAASLLTGCGGKEEPFPVDPPFELEEPAAYFGVEPCVCYEYRDVNDPASPLRLGIAVENVSAFYSHEAKKKVEHIIRYRYGPNGAVVRTDFVDPTDPDLLLLRTDISGTDSADSLRLDPPIPFLRAPAEDQGRVSAETQATHVFWVAGDEGQELKEETQGLKMEMVYALEPKQVIIKRTDELGLKKDEVAVDAYRVTFREFVWDGEGHSWQENYRLFSPELGVVELQFPVEGETKTWRLDEVRRLEGCKAEVTTNVERPKDHCGVQK